VTLQNQPSADLKNTILEAKLDTNGQKTSKTVGALQPLEIHNDSNEFSDAGSMAGTLASQGEFYCLPTHHIPIPHHVLVSNIFFSLLSLPFSPLSFLHLSSLLLNSDSEAMAALHGRLDRLESLLLAALRK